MNFYRYKYHTALLLGVLSAILFRAAVIGVLVFFVTLTIFNYLYRRIVLENYNWFHLQKGAESPLL